MANEKSVGLLNLKTIHKIQVGGELQNILRDIRNTKTQLESLMKNTSKAKQNRVNAKPVEVEERKVELIDEKSNNFLA